MNWQENKLELTVGAIAVLGFTTVFSMTQLFHTQSKLSWLNISYEMPKAKSSYSPEFDLAGREISRNYINPNAKKSNSTTTPVAATKATTLVDKSKETAKAQALAAANKTKKPKMTVKTVEKDSNSGFTSEGNLVVENTVVKALPFEPAKKINTAPVKSQNATADEEKDWKKLFQTSANQALMVEFVTAYYDHKVTDDQYFDVLKDLLLSQNEQNQSLGTYGLKSVFTVRSFYEAVKIEQTPEVQKKASLATAIESYLLSFNQAQRLTILDASLRSTNQDIVVKAAQVIVDGINKIKAGENFGLNRDQRNTVTTSSLGSYKKFIPTLQRLEQSTDQDIVQAASAALNQIQSVANIAQNS